MLTLKEKTFDDIIGKTNKIELVLIHSNCQICKIVKPIIEEISTQYNNQIICYEYKTKIVDSITKRYNAIKLPHILILVDGFMMNEFIGLISKHQIESYLNTLINSCM